MIPETLRATRSLPGWVVALGPLVLLVALVTLIVRTAPADRLRPQGAPPVERLAIERTTLSGDGIHLSVLNDGPDPNNREDRYGIRRRNGDMKPVATAIQQAFGLPAAPV